MERIEIVRNALIMVIGVILMFIGSLILITDPYLTTFQQNYALIFGQPLTYTILYQAFPLGLIAIGTGIIILGVFIVFLLDKPPDQFTE